MSSTLQRVKTLVPQWTMTNRTKRFTNLFSLIPSTLLLKGGIRNGYGIADEEDQRRIEDALVQLIEEITTNNNNTRTRINELDNYLSKNEEIIDTFSQGITNNSQALRELTDRFKRINGRVTYFRPYLELFPALINKLITDISSIQGIQSRINTLYQGIMSLVQGKVTPSLIPTHILEEAITKAKSKIKDTIPEFHLQFDQPSYVYTGVEVPIFGMARNTLIVDVTLPLSRNDLTFDVFSIQHFGSPVIFRNSSEFHILKVIGLPDNIAISQDGTQYIPLSAQDMIACQGKWILHCNSAIAYRTLLPNTCITALWLDNKNKAANLCPLSYIPKRYPEEKIIRLSNSKIAIFSYERSAAVVCPEQPVKPIKLSGLTVVELGCACSLSTTTSVVPAQLAGCNREKQSTIIHYPGNAILFEDITRNLATNWTGLVWEALEIQEKPLNYKPADIHLLQGHTVPLERIRQSIRKTKPIDLTPFEPRRYRPPIFTGTPFGIISTTTLVIAGVILISAIIFFRKLYKRTTPRGMASSIFALNLPGARAMSTQEQESTTLRDIYVAALVSAVLTTIFVYVVKRIIKRYTNRPNPQESTILLQITSLVKTRTYKLTKSPFPPEALRAQHTDMVDSISPSITSTSATLNIRWKGSVTVHELASGGTPLEVPLPTLITIDRKMASEINIVNKAKIWTRLVAKQGINVTKIFSDNETMESMGWAPLVSPAPTASASSIIYDTVTPVTPEESALLEALQHLQARRSPREMLPSIPIPAPQIDRPPRVLPRQRTTEEPMNQDNYEEVAY